MDSFCRSRAIQPKICYIYRVKIYVYIYILYIWWNNAVFVSALKNLPLDIISNSQLANFSASELERNSKLSKIAEKNEKDLINLVSNWETANWKRCASFVFHFQDLFRIKVCIRKVNLYFSKNVVVVPRKAAKLENLAWIFCETSFDQWLQHWKVVRPNFLCVRQTRIDVRFWFHPLTFDHSRNAWKV